jgi:hypothetical protein
MSQTTNQIDAVVSAMWPGIVEQQSRYFSANGEHYQILWTHDSPPSSPGPPNSLGDRPTDQPASAVQGLPSLMRSRMRIDTYGSPHGWTLTLEAVIDGQLWSRSIDCGVDASRSMPWEIVIPPDDTTLDQAFREAAAL